MGAGVIISLAYNAFRLLWILLPTSFLRYYALVMDSWNKKYLIFNIFCNSISDHGILKYFMSLLLVGQRLPSI